ncbi:MAG TPA: carbohydrate binding domain-containing protein [Candidatus Acidoferrales bacterium]|nr:carbohydrate binding domain-containing protein [Candidatus Acidoferrales bacterium]
MRIDLTRRAPRALFFLVVLLLGTILAAYAGKAWLVEHWSASSRPELWLRAASLEPGDAATWRRLALNENLWLDTGGVRQAVRYLERAAQIDPHSGELWTEVAAAREREGDPAGAREAYERAQIDYPISAEVAWRYGSFLLYQGNFSAGYAEIKRALVVDPSLTASAVSECWQANPNSTPILNDVLPAAADDYSTARDFFLARNLLDPALAVWNRQLHLSLPVKMPEAIPLVDALIDSDRLGEAQRTWAQALQAANWQRAEGRGPSLVFNGGFERAIANGGFDWREISASGASYAVDGQIAHSGSHSLRIELGGTANLDFRNVFQFVPVGPRTRYQFSAFLRTSGVSTDQGVRFELFDPRHPSEVSILTPNVTGTNPWSPVRAEFTTGQDTDLLEIALRRVPSWKFDNKIRGTIWIDDVALAPAAFGPNGGPR